MRPGAAMLIGAATLLSACAEQAGGYAHQPMLPVPTIPTTDTPRRLIPGMSRAILARVTTVPA